MIQESATFRSAINGIQFDSVNPTTNMLLSHHSKSQFVQPEKAQKPKGGKAKISVDPDNEQEIS